DLDVGLFERAVSARLSEDRHHAAPRRLEHDRAGGGRQLAAFAVECNQTRRIESRQRFASAVAVCVAGDRITAESIEDLAEVAGVHVDVIFGFGDHFVEKNVGKNIRDRTTLPAWRNLVEILAVDRRYEALSTREHVHVYDRNSNQRPAENLGRELARQPHQRVDGRIFRRMHAGGKAEYGSITAAID